MENLEISTSCISNHDAEEPRDEFQEWLITLPKERNFDGLYLYHYKGFWCPSLVIKGMVSFQRHFQAHDTDILLATVPKSGTTWLKALIFSIVNRTKFSLSHSPLLTSNPHELIPFYEYDLYAEDENPNLEVIPCPRIFSTHTPYKALPQSIVNSKCRIVYVGRNPLDHFVSYWHFILKNRSENTETPSLHEGFELFCRGIHRFGPFWDHVLGYWRATLESQQKVLFLKYEDLREDVISHVKKLAEFLGFPFSTEEEKQGLVEQITSMCSFENLKNLEVNQPGRVFSMTKNSSFFRKGQVGDWANYLSPSMAERFEKIIEEKLGGSGLTFKDFSKPKVF